MLQRLSSAILNSKPGTVEADRTMHYKEAKKAIYNRIIYREPLIWFLSSKTSTETLFALFRSVSTAQIY